MALRGLATQVEGDELQDLLRREAVIGQDDVQGDQVPDGELEYLDEEHGQEEIPQEERQQHHTALQADVHADGVLLDFQIRGNAGRDTVRGQDLWTAIEVRWNGVAVA